jgi:ATP-dependent Clp protease ATP-binding subunit ClpA
LKALDLDSRRVVTAAHHEAYQYATGFLASTHLLLALLTVDSAATAIGLDDRILPERIRRQVELFMGPLSHPVRPVHLPYTPHARAILINAAALASQGGEPAAATPHHLWSALKGTTGSLAARCLADVDAFRDHIGGQG